MHDGADDSPLGPRAGVTVGPESSMCLSFVAEQTAIAEVRRAVRRLVRHRFSAERVDDIVLAASELATNAVEHAGSPTFTVALLDTGSMVRLTVCSTTVAELDLNRLIRPDALADPTATRGRGLGIVRAVSDHVQVDAVDGELVVCCQFFAG